MPKVSAAAGGHIGHVCVSRGSLAPQVAAGLRGSQPFLSCPTPSLSQAVAIITNTPRPIGRSCANRTRPRRAQPKKPRQPQKRRPAKIRLAPLLPHSLSTTRSLLAVALLSECEIDRRHGAITTRPDGPRCDPRARTPRSAFPSRQRERSTAQGRARHAHFNGQSLAVVALQTVEPTA
jgi:hypothetical protein